MFYVLKRITHVNHMHMEAIESQDRIPAIIGVRTDKHRRGLRQWRRRNKHVSWSVLLHCALDTYFEKQEKEKAA